MEEEFFVWDDELKKLNYIRISKPEDQQNKGQKKQSQVTSTSIIYCPHSYLIPRFKDTLNPSEKLNFRKQYLRKVSPNEPNVITLQDVKDLVMYLLATPVSLQFINFFHLPVIDLFLRVLILYFQYYTEIWQELMEERAAIAKNISYPLPKGKKARCAKELKILRCILARQYGNLIIGCQDGKYYHHMMAGKGQAPTITQSQGEKDLRIFETLIAMAHRVIWIALQRKYFNIIEIELHRLLRTDAYNIAERQSGNSVMKNVLQTDVQILHGPTLRCFQRKLLMNSPLIQELLYSECDYRILLIGTGDINPVDPYITYLQNALLAGEDELLQLNIEVGILGQNRSNFDIMLMPLEEEKHVTSKEENVIKLQGKRDLSKRNIQDQEK